MKIKTIGAAIVAAGFCVLALTTPALAHHNMFQKAGKAVQYTTRKDAENLSQTTHQAIGHNSVHHNRKGINAHTRYVLKPSGEKVRIYHHHHYRHHVK
jgi:hypothetical protein